MNTCTLRPRFPRTLLAAAVSAAMLAACATAPMKPPGADAAREKLIQLQTDPQLGNLAPAAMQDAQDAVRTAQIPNPDPRLSEYRVYLADRKVESARAEAEARFAEGQHQAILARRTSIRLDARTGEADRADARAVKARADEQVQAQAAQDARSAAATQQTAEMQRQIDALQAKATDRGLVLTLGDVLFKSGQADLGDGAAGHLDRLVAFLDRYPDRTARIEGHTDDVGTERFNRRLSERRADAVQAYLTEHGVDGARLRAAGEGEADPVADNDNADGRRQNRRVEVIISNGSVAAH